MTERLTDEQALAMTIWAEARAEPIEGEVAVGCIIRNRVLQGGYGDGWKGVIFKPWQFSCWLLKGGAENHRMLMRRVEECLAGRMPWPPQQSWIAKGLINGAIEDRVAGANHYYSPEAMVPAHAVPKWAKGKKPVVVIGRHLFFRL